MHKICCKGHILLTAISLKWTLRSNFGLIWLGFRCRMWLLLVHPNPLSWTGSRSPVNCLLQWPQAWQSKSLIMASEEKFWPTEVMVITSQCRTVLSPCNQNLLSDVTRNKVSQGVKGGGGYVESSWWLRLEQPAEGEADVPMSIHTLIVPWWKIVPLTTISHYLRRT